MRISDWSSDVCSSDLVAREQLRELEVGFGEERALDAAAAVFQRHERLRLAALADAAHLAGDDHGGFRPPAAAFLLRAVVLAGGPQRVELAEVAADQRGQFVAIGIEWVDAQIMAERVAFADRKSVV